MAELKNRLVGADASLMKATFGPEITSGASVSGQWYKIEKRSNTVLTAAGVAEKIRAMAFTGWVITGATDAVIFTADANGARAGTYSVSFGATGAAATGGLVQTTPGDGSTKEVRTLTITTGALTEGNIIITLNDVAFNKELRSSIFPIGYLVGDLWLGEGSTFTATDSAKLTTFTEVADVTSFSLEYSADEIEVTVLADEVKKYRRGKTDMSGTVEGINIISEMEKVGSFINRFMRTVNATAGNVSTLNEIDGDPLFCQFYVQKDVTTPTETQAFLFAQVDLYGTSLGASVADAQSWSSNVRIIGNDPILYFKANS
jgi:hypothetical protein